MATSRVPVRVEWDEGNLRALINGPIRADTERRARRVRAVARALCPKASGETARSIDYVIEGARGQGWVARVGSDNPVVLWLNNGTGIYGPNGREIVAQNSEFLQWTEADGTSVRARSVAGQPGRHFMELAVDAYD